MKQTTTYRGFTLQVTPFPTREGQGPQVYTGSAHNGDYELTLDDMAVRPSTILELLRAMIDEHLDEGKEDHARND